MKTHLPQVHIIYLFIYLSLRFPCSIVPWIMSLTFPWEAFNLPLMPFPHRYICMNALDFLINRDWETIHNYRSYLAKPNKQMVSLVLVELEPVLWKAINLCTSHMMNKLAFAPSDHFAIIVYETQLSLFKKIRILILLTILLYYYYYYYYYPYYYYDVFLF